MSSHNRTDQARTAETGGAASGHGDGHGPAAAEPGTQPPGTDDRRCDQPPPAEPVPDGAVSDQAETTPPRPDPRGRQGLAMIGPTSEATRRWVAESRMRQGLSPHINDPAVLESLALFLRNALDTINRDGKRNGK